MMISDNNNGRNLGRISLLVFLAVVLLCLAPVYVDAQCAMCTLNAEQSVQGENTQGRGLNNGILFLLSAPYIAVAVLGYVWYKKYRKGRAEEEDPIRLN